MHFTIITFVIFALIGCSAAGVVYTADPYQKVSDSYMMMDAGRQIPAERFAKEALLEFTKNGDKFGQGEANVALGLLYKSQLMKSYEKSIIHFNQAIDAFRSVNDNSQLAKS